MSIDVPVSSDMDFASLLLSLPQLPQPGDLCAIPTSGWAATERSALEGAASFSIEGTPRYQIQGTTEVTMEGPAHAATLVWRPEPREIINDLVRDHLVRNLTRDHGEPRTERREGSRVWTWTDGTRLRELVVIEDASGSPTDITLTERTLAMAWDQPLDTMRIVECELELEPA